jgi:hypothetical protein
MPALVVEDGAQLTLKWTKGVETYYNVLGLRVNAGFVIDQAAANNCAAAVNRAFVAAPLASFLDASTLLAQVGIRDLRFANLAEYLAPTSNTVGTGTLEATSAAMACCVTIRTSKAGKRFRGRVYLPLNAEASFDGETSVYAVPAAAAGSNFIQQINNELVGQAGITGQLKLAVISRKSTPPIATPMVSCQVRSQIATTQRRRLPKRG